MQSGRRWIRFALTGAILLVLCPGSRGQDVLREYHHFGHAVDGAGDVNQDGVPDLVTSGGGPNPVPNTSVVRVFSSLDGSVLHSFLGTWTDSFASRSGQISGAGDVNGDGYHDILIGAPGFSGRDGRAWVKSGLDGTDLHVVAGQQDDSVGVAVSEVGDLDADGSDDFLVTSPGDDTLFPDAGAAHVYSGASGAILRSVHGSSGERMGSAACAAGDMNNDGFVDFAVSRYAGSSAVSGRVVVHSGFDGSRIHLLETGLNGDSLGYDLSGGADVNADGFDDLIVNAPNLRLIDQLGAALVYSGRDARLLYTYFGDRGGTVLLTMGWMVTMAGDLNGDGHGDFASSARVDLLSGPSDEHVRVYSGRTGTELFRIHGNVPDDRMGYSLARLGDVDQDGRDELVASSLYEDTELHWYVQVVSPARTSIESYGSGCPGHLGLTPMLRVDPGAYFGGLAKVIVRNARKTRPGLLLAGPVRASIPIDSACDLLLDPVFALLPFTTGPLGTASVSGSVPASWSAPQLNFQAFVMDDATSRGVSVSNGVSLVRP